MVELESLIVVLFEGFVGPVLSGSLSMSLSLLRTKTDSVNSSGSSRQNSAGSKGRGPCLLELEQRRKNMG